MHFDWYLDNQFLLNAYGRYFWYLEISRATQVLAAYANNEFAGVLLAEMKGGEKKKQNFFPKIYINLNYSWRYKSHKIRHSYHYNHSRHLTRSQDSLKMGRLLL